jgi:hypothetical protein
LILSLVAPEEVAIPTIGDLAEEASLRGGASFWPDVARTFASQLWRDLCDRPFGLARLALSGFVLIPIWSALLTIPFACLAAVIISLLQGFGVLPVIHPDAHTTMGPMMIAANSSWMTWLSSALTYTVAPLFVGYSRAERSNGREIAVALASIAVFGAFGFLGQPARIGGVSAPLPLISDLFLITGAILCRFRYLGLKRQARQQNKPAVA